MIKYYKEQQRNNYQRQLKYIIHTVLGNVHTKILQHHPPEQLFPTSENVVYI